MTIWGAIGSGLGKIGEGIATGAKKVGEVAKTGIGNLSQATKTGAQKTGDVLKTGQQRLEEVLLGSQTNPQNPAEPQEPETEEQKQKNKFANALSGFESYRPAQQYGYQTTPIMTDFSPYMGLSAETQRYLYGGM